MQTFLDGAPDSLRRDAVRFVVLHLLLAAVFGDRYEGVHALRNGVRKEDHFAIDVARRATGCLNERSLTAQKSFLVCIQDAYKRNLG